VREGRALTNSVGVTTSRSAPHGTAAEEESHERLVSAARAADSNNSGRKGMEMKWK